MNILFLGKALVIEFREKWKDRYVFRFDYDEDNTFSVYDGQRWILLRGEKPE
jgi:hypothetical protein